MADTTAPGTPGASPVELVVLLDAEGRPSGAMPKATVHHAATPLHLAFSCHVVDPAGRVLITRRSAAKATWPATWTNACCGHPLPGESLRRAVTRRLRDELGVTPRRLALALPDFAYRAVMGDGVVEHELCPVVVAEVADLPAPDPAEVDDLAWLAWDDLVARARTEPGTLSPWSVEQIDHLAALARSPHEWLAAALAPEHGAWGELGLDHPRSATAPSASASATPAPAVPSGARVGGGGAGDDPVAVVRGPVEAVLGEFLAEREQELAELGAPIAELGAEVRRLVAAGGKRLRPAFVYWGHRASGAGHDDGVLTAAAAVELLHTFALVHDDVMDRSAERRGRPTAQRSFADRHRGEGLAGDPEWFGVSGALLAGDLAFVWADQLLESTPLPVWSIAAARRVFTDLRTEVVAGQYLDVRLAHHSLDAGVPVAGALEREARRVALLKSARYTVTRPLELGLALAGAGAGADTGQSALLDSLRAYGDAVGLAFQMRDDVLGLFGDDHATGKSRLDDLREGKRTLLVLRALRLADAEGRRLLAGALGDPDLDEATAHRCRRVVAASGALASVEALIEAEHDRALRAVAGLAGPAGAALEELAGLAVRRDR